MSNYPTPHESIRSAIDRWEGGWSNHPNDRGNYVNCNGRRKLVGTMRGVTANTFARMEEMDPCDVTPELMQQAVTLNYAANVGVKLYYEGPRFDEFEWSPLIEILVDYAWASGPATALKQLQRLVGAVTDGIIGPQTLGAVEAAYAAKPIDDLVGAFSEMRAQHYIRISQPGTPNAVFQRGWLRRVNWFRPTNAEWWSEWQGWRPVTLDPAPKPVDPPVRPAVQKSGNWFTRLLDFLFGTRLSVSS